MCAILIISNAKGGSAVASIYEGSKPFVFVSYSHKDTPYVIEVINALDANGVRIWYDSGIEAGSEWPENIAKHLKACACVLCFISPNYDASDNCRRELAFSLNLKKPTLSLYIEQFQMSDGLQLQLGLSQAMFCSRFSTAAVLTDSLANLPMVAVCRKGNSNADENDTHQANNDAEQQLYQIAEWEHVNLGNNTIEITACKGQIPPDITFPSDIDGKKVVSIGGMVFGAAKAKGAVRLRVESVLIPQGVASIGSGIFDGCKNLKEVSLPLGLSFIGDNAFKNCKALTNITIPDSVSHIGSGAFSGSSIKSIVLPGGISSIPAEGFKNCKKLVSITVPNGVISIQRESFYGCKSITRVNLPQGLISIGRDAFHNCESLTNIVLPDSIKDIGYQAFEWCALTIETLPSSMTIIENSSFEGCNFTTLAIPDGVTQIRDYAFSDCWSLRKIIIPNSVIKIEEDAFFNIMSEITIACFKDSYAHKWAQKNNVAFELIE